MCGITGFYCPRGLSVDQPEDCLGQMLEHIEHRGPDEQGSFVDSHIGFGTARLAIIDLQTGSQPVWDSSGRYCICYNGELYNYLELRSTLEAEGVEFYTQSDTEVVLAAWIHWKEKCISRFNGAFAFAVYDTFERSLVLARDRFGKRPLFYLQRKGTLFFASEMKAFLAVPGFEFEFDEEELSSILAVWTPLPSQSGFKHIRQLPMAHFLVSSERELLQVKPYEELSFSACGNFVDEADAMDQLRTSLTRSVELRLRSDFETGVYLSGGIDSSIVTALATQLSSRSLRTFSVEFEDPEFDESSFQNVVASHFGSRHSSVSVSSQSIVNAFPDAVYHAEVPTFRTAFVPMYLLAQHVQQQGIKVVLSGEGADEAFLGYNIFPETLLRRAWHQLSVSERTEKLAKMYPYLKHYADTHQHRMLGLYQQFSRETMPGLFSHELRFQNGKFAARLLKTTADPFDALYALIGNSTGYDGLSPTQKAQWLEFNTLLPGYLLSTQGERMSLSHGVENRCPFLDPDVVRLSASINLQFDDGFEPKLCLKKAFGEVLPQQILQREKQPYRAPESAPFIRERPDYLELILSERQLSRIEGLNHKFVAALSRKVMTKDPSEISTRENQAFIFLLSISLLHYRFVQRQSLTSFEKPAVLAEPPIDSLRSIG